MNNQIVRARKKHRCGACGGMIRPGHSYELNETREPRYEGYEYPQVGVKYVRVRLCLECVDDDGLNFGLNGCKFRGRV